MANKFDKILNRYREQDAGGGGGAWGSITGTLSDQTDLQVALDAKLDDTQLDTDGTLAANSDTKIASQKATKTYADTKLGLHAKADTAGNADTVTTNANLTGPITSIGNATTIGNSINLPANPTTTTQAPADNSTKIATTAYVDAAVLGQNFKEATRVATTANLVGAYLAGVFTYTATGTDVIDGVTLALNDRVLVKNQTDNTQNGIYKVTTAGALGIAGILTRATDANSSTEFKTGDSNFVTSGTANSSTTWAYTGADNPTIGSDAITYAQTAGQGTVTAGNGITITGLSVAINTAVTADLSTAQALTNKDLTGAGNTFPTFNQNTSGSAATLGTTRTIWGQNFNGSANVSGDQTGIGNMTGGASSMIITAGTGNSRTLTLRTTTSGGTATTALTLNADQTATFAAALTALNLIATPETVTVSSNAGTCAVGYYNSNFTNSSAANMTVTLATSGAVDGQIKIVRIYDATAVAKTITWVNTENSTITVPGTSNGSTTLPVSAAFQFNGSTSKWRCIGSV